MRRHERFFIGGEWVAAHGTGEQILVNPADETPFASVRLGDAEDVDRAVRAARAAFEDFSGTDKSARIALLERIIEAYEARRADIAAVVTEETGSPASATVQVNGPLDQFRQAIQTLRDYDFEHRVGDTLVRREPIGVCGLITPWNWPVQTPCTKLAPALAAGCTVVLKPSEYSPLSALLLAEIMEAARVPPGVFNLVNGDGPGVGAAIAAHPDVDFISFTGSTRAGILVADAAAPTVKRVAQELGGKSANVVLPDADLAAAARWNVARGFFNSGQSCHAPSRILVQRDQMSELVRHLVAEARKQRAGDPRDPATTLGPLVNRNQFERVQHYIKVGLDEGATLATGGPGRPEGLNRGFYAKPTVFSDVAPDMAVAQEEIFGPVLSVIPYRDEEEAIGIANGTPYGLGGYVFSSSRDRALAVGKRLRAGRIVLNGAPTNAAAPMGGYKRSGNGREMGVFGFEEYLEVKAIFGAEGP
jgi:aldehyde dehydrogenase (NAD+)